MKQFFQEHKTGCYIFLIWEALHLCLLAAGNGNGEFYPTISYGSLVFDISNYGLTEFCVYALLIPTCSTTYWDLIWIPNAEKRALRRQTRKDAEVIKKSKTRKKNAEIYLNAARKAEKKVNLSKEEKEEQEHVKETWTIIILASLLLIGTVAAMLYQEL